jgi:hypothetical protein
MSETAGRYNWPIVIFCNLRQYGFEYSKKLIEILIWLLPIGGDLERSIISNFDRIY